jgi:hypothetical protein
LIVDTLVDKIDIETRVYFAESLEIQLDLLETKTEAKEIALKIIKDSSFWEILTTNERLKKHIPSGCSCTIQ